MEQLLLHLFGDYIVQNDWMALNKTKRGWKGFLACLIHVLTYSIPFLIITSWQAVFFIALTHFVIDRTKIVQHLIRWKNDGSIKNFGFREERPVFIAFWIYVIIDNTIHLMLNYWFISMF